MPTRLIRYGDASLDALVEGMSLMTRLLRPTLGPLPRTVAISPHVAPYVPEVVDHAATIARRMIKIEDPFLNAGAMLVRHLAWRQHLRVGDGAATAAVIAERLLIESRRLAAAGANPVGLERGIRDAARTVRETLRSTATPIDTPDEIAAVVRASAHDEALAKVVAEAVDGAGPDGMVIVEAGVADRPQLDHIEGVRWDAEIASPYLLPEEGATARIIDPRVLLYDGEISTAEQMAPALEACLRDGSRAIFVVAHEIKDSAVGLLLTNRDRRVLEAVLAAKAPSVGSQRVRILEDLAIITGGRCIRPEHGDTLDHVRPEDLGSARQAWATRAAWGVFGGRGSVATVRQRVVAVRAELEQAADDPASLPRIRERIGRLLGLTTRVMVSGMDERTRDEQKLRAEAAVASAQAAVRGGVVVGGGGALIHAARGIDRTGRNDEACGRQALALALEEPMRVIAANAGLASEHMVARARGHEAPLAYNVLAGTWSDAVLDPLDVVEAALDTAISAATIALTTGAVVHRPKGPISWEP
jgi:chaperonin GroEL